jgi:hypothetical protein
MMEIAGPNNWLVLSLPLGKLKVSWDDYSQNMENVPNHQSDNY